jgi:Uma2 family endonuclease
MISMTARLLPLPKPSASTLMLPGVTWNQYEQLLQVFADRQFHLTYDQGRMEIRMPTPEHERPATLLDKILTILTLAFDLDIYSLGSTHLHQRSSRERPGA